MNGTQQGLDPDVPALSRRPSTAPPCLAHEPAVPDPSYASTARSARSRWSSTRSAHVGAGGPDVVMPATARWTARGRAASLGPGARPLTTASCRLGTQLPEAGRRLFEGFASPWPPPAYDARPQPPPPLA